MVSYFNFQIEGTNPVLTTRFSHHISLHFLKIALYVLPYSGELELYLVSAIHTC